MSRPVVRWVVEQGASGTLGALVLGLGPSGEGALVAGRVFVDGRRSLEPGVVVREGSVVDVHRARDADGEVSILAEHEGFVFVDKPPGVATEPDHAGVKASVLSRVAVELGVPQRELHALSRLDVGVSGVVTLARSAEAREMAQQLRARGAFRRRYVALCLGAPTPSTGTWDQALAPPRGGRPSPGDERAAETRFQTIASARRVFITARHGHTAGTPSLLALAPVTGRTHQLRLHAAQAGVPLLGDALHGGPARLGLEGGGVRELGRVALHAAWVELELGGRRLRVVASLPSDLQGLWRELGGSDDDWQHALDATFAGLC